MPAAARPHCILPARNLETLTIFPNFQPKRLCPAAETEQFHRRCVGRAYPLAHLACTEQKPELLIVIIFCAEHLLVFSAFFVITR